MKVLAFSGGKDSMACLHLLRGELECAIYVDTGFSYPETREMVAYAISILPVHVVRSDRHGQNAREGVPADVVPINWTRIGQQCTGEKAVTIQSYIGCCYENIARPLLDKAHAIGVTELVYGQRRDESHTASSRNGDVVEGIVRLHPIEDWTADRVIAYLRGRMDVPAHYAINHSSLDCYDCTAYRQQSADRIAWTRERYPHFYSAYRQRADALSLALEQTR